MRLVTKFQGLRLIFFTIFLAELTQPLCRRPLFVFVIFANILTELAQNTGRKTFWRLFFSDLICTLPSWSVFVLLILGHAWFHRGNPMASFSTYKLIQLITFYRKKFLHPCFGHNNQPAVFTYTCLRFCPNLKAG